MGDFGSRVLAGRELAKRIGEDKRAARQPLEKLDWTPLNFTHRMSLEQVEHEVGEVPVFVANCKCGWSSSPRSQSLVRADYDNHAPNLWEVA